MTEFPQIPSKYVFKRLDELTPSRYTSLENGCAYSFLLRQAVVALGPPSRLMPPLSYRNVIGTVIHKVFELVNKKELSPNRNEIKAFWKAEIKRQELKISEEYPALRNVSIVDYSAMFDTIRVVEKLFSVSTVQPKQANTILHPNEHKVKIVGLLSGSIDRVDSLSDGSFRVVDYKSGKVFNDDGSIKEEYIVQLNLYAYLLEEQEKVKVSRLAIIDKTGTCIPVPYHPEKKQEVFNQVKATLERINTAVEQKQPEKLCSSSEDNCRFCQVAHLCKNRIEPQDSPYKIIEGTITSITNDDQLVVSTSNGSLTVAKFRALDLDSAEWASLAGKEAVFVNLFQVIENRLYNRTDNTVIYIKETE